MKQILVLLLAPLLCPITVEAQARACSKRIKTIKGCPVTGCGGAQMDQNRAMDQAVTGLLL